MTDKSSWTSTGQPWGTQSKHSGSLCSSGKIFYRDEWRAELALLNAAQKPDDWPDDQEWVPCRSYYRCRECRNWHLTTLTPEQQWDSRS